MHVLGTKHLLVSMASSMTSKQASKQAESKQSGGFSCLVEAPGNTVMIA